MATSPKGPFKLVTVNTSPERAHRLIGRLVDDLQDRYTIIHAANCDTIDNVRTTVEREQPDILFCASMWTPEQSNEIRNVAREVKPNIVTYALPQGLQVQRGPDAVVEHLHEVVPPLIEKHFNGGN